MSTFTKTTLQQRVKLAQRLVDLLARELKLVNFTVNTWSTDEWVGIDFHNEQLRKVLNEKLLRSRIYENGLKAEQYAGVTTRGSIWFYAKHDKDEISYSGDIPISMIRPDEPLSSFAREVVREWYPPTITEVHLHMWDHKPAVHVHIEGNIEITERDILNPTPFLNEYVRVFRNYIMEIDRISKSFLHII